MNEPVGEVVPPIPEALSIQIEHVLIEHRMDDEARTCTCGNWKWEPGPARPSELHRLHLSLVLAAFWWGQLEQVSCDRYPYGCGLGDGVPVYIVREEK